MFVNKEDFIKYFQGTFWKKLKESLVPFREGEIPESKPGFLEGLCSEINRRVYFPAHPREYIVYDKHNYVSRIIPTFQFKESCVFFFCIKELEKFIAVNHIEGTFGGWSLGNLIKDMEEAELDGHIDVHEYLPANSFNPFKWTKNWKDFQAKAYQYSKKMEFNVVIKFDIANFYDSINLNTLERQIRLVATKDKSFVIDLLFHFLSNWNRLFEHYSAKKVGLPQDEIGDCSRILANFYLQDYDKFMKTECGNKGALYLRYADDQLIYAKDEVTAKSILFDASKELFKINLNVNSSKVEIFKSKNEFYNYWAFDIFELLDNLEDKAMVNEGVRLYLEKKKSGATFRDSSVLKRILSVDFSLLEPHLRHSILASTLDPVFLCRLDFWAFKKILEKLEKREDLYKILDEQINIVQFNSYHFNLLKLYKKYRPDGPIDKIEKRIKELSMNLSAESLPA